MKKAFSLLLVLSMVLGVSLAAVPVGVVGASTSTINVSQPVQVTNSTYYERGQSIVYNGTHYWLFYGQSVSVTSAYNGTTGPDTHDYKIYYKVASTVAGLAAATPTLLNHTDNHNIYQGEISAATDGGLGWIFVFGAVDRDGTPGGQGCDLYRFATNDSGTTWTSYNYTGAVSGVLPDGAAHHAAVNYTGQLWVAWYNGSNWTSKYYTTSGGWSTEKVIFTGDAMGKFYVEGTHLYFVRANNARLDIYEWNGSTWSTISGAGATEAGALDPTIYKVGSNYICAYAPWVSPSQWIKAKVGTSLSTLLSSPTVTVNITAGGYGGNAWVDMWPTGFTDNSGTTYLFFTSERNPSDPSSEIAGNIWYLKVDWPVTNDHYTYIQNAVDAASSTTINVAAGTYRENVVIGKSLTLKAASTPVINGDTDANGVPNGSCITVNTNGVTIDGFELTNGYNGIMGATSGSTIQNCIIHNNLNYVGSNGAGIDLWGENDDNKILDNEIYNNDRQGIFIGYDDFDGNPNTTPKISTGNNISGNTIYNNGKYTQTNGPDASAYGIQLWNADGNTIEGNEVYNHDDWFPSPGFDFAQGIYLCASFDNTVTCNDLHGNNYGVGVWSMSRTLVGSNEINRNNIVNNTGYGVRNYDAVTIDAENNYWGDDSGPYHATLNPTGLGNPVSNNVDFDPWIKKAAATTTGTGNATFSPSQGNIVGLAAVAVPAGAPFVEFPHGMFSFKICCINPGDTVTLTVTLPAAVPVGTVWWKYQNGSWYSLPNLSDNGDSIMVISLTDGGSGDGDLSPDGQIVDPGGPGYPWPASAPAYGLDISSTAGGSVTTPGEGTFPYLPGWVVDLVASPDPGYKFVNWTGDVGTIADVHDASTTITMLGWYVITANFESEEIPQPQPPVYPTVTTKATTTITTNSTTLNMNYTVGNYTSVQVRFAYKKSADSAWSYTDWVSKSGSGTYAEPRTGLSSSTKYDFKAQLKYNDTVIEGTTLQFTTATPPTPQVSGGCFIATAAYGTPTAEQIDVLREFRDAVLMKSAAGSQFVALYYRLSPPIADFIAGNEFVRTLVRELVVDPIVWIVEATGDIWGN